MSLRPEIKDRAHDDTVRQYRWYCKRAGVEVANRYLETVDSAMLKLAERPFLGTLCRFPGVRFRDLRFFPLERPYDAFLIFYRFDSTTLEVTRVLHGARDLPRLKLGEDEAIYGGAASPAAIPEKAQA